MVNVLVLAIPPKTPIIIEYTECQDVSDWNIDADGLYMFTNLVAYRHEGGLLKFLHSKYVFMRLRFALFFSSSFKKFDKTSSSSVKILTKERK